ncbi:exonuclease SbcCD subunit D [Lapidilactobacillus bayanensis]|uniref:exonuclease SbcCD subunit D n=1 Tax=Lapidilactobacillus bayanensis TaxID=2485998 RepID=UPI000F7B16C1|nr:exonuclease SbcCD subunit D [Lapidilactobacillus bayanensis]
MRFLHTADWHLGRRLFGYDLVAEQDAAFEQLIKIAEEEQVDAIVVAGDLYDRQNPAEAAVAQLTEMISRINLQVKLPLLMINGNHDSAVRLGVGNQWFAATDFYLHTELDQAFEPVEIGDSQFFLLPYFELYQARQYFEDDSIRTLEQAMTRIIAKLQQQFLLDKKHVLIAHFFAAGSSHSDSETTVNVGGLDAVSLDLLKDFDYVALGHVHNKDALQNSTIRYSGSLIKYSLSEENQTKGVLIVDTDPEIKVKFRPIKPLRDVQTVEGSFKDLTNADYLSSHQIDQDAYTGIVLDDTNVISNASVLLRQQFPHFLTMSRANGISTFTTRQISTQEIKSPMTLLDKFYQEMTQQPLSEQQRQWAEQALKEVDE